MSGNLIRYLNEHLFSSRRYGTICSYCNIDASTKEQKKAGEKEEGELEVVLFTQEIPPVCNGIVYHNNGAVYTPTVLSAYDVIEMGKSKFVFVPFCGENFMWEDSAAGGQVSNT